METLIELAEKQKFVEFEPKVKDILKEKVAEKLKEKKYFDRLDQAKSIFEEKTETSE